MLYSVAHITYLAPTVFASVLPVCDRTIPVTLVLKDPHHPDQDLGSLELAVTLTPKDSPIEERRDSTVRMNAADGSQFRVVWFSLLVSTEYLEKMLQRQRLRYVE